MLSDIEHEEVVEKLRLISRQLWYPSTCWHKEARYEVDALLEKLNERRVDAPHAHMCDCNRCAG